MPQLDILTYFFQLFYFYLFLVAFFVLVVQLFLPATVRNLKFREKFIIGLKNYYDDEDFVEYSMCDWFKEILSAVQHFSLKEYFLSYYLFCFSYFRKYLKSSKGSFYLFSYSFLQNYNLKLRKINLPLFLIKNKKKKNVIMFSGVLNNINKLR